MKTLNFIIATALLLVAAQRHSFAGSATWDQNPTSSDWNTATNWTPPTVPNGVSDTATFETSDVSNITISSTIRLASCIFDQGASGFRITSDDSGELTFDGAGVINNSTNPQSFVVKLDGENFSFVNEATIAGLVRFVVKGSSIGQGVPAVVFRDDSSAGSATFLNEPGDFDGGIEIFYDNSTAENARFVCRSNTKAGSGQVSFNNLSSAGHGTFIVDGCGNISPASTPLVFFDNFSTADHATFTVYGSAVSGAPGGAVVFEHHATAAHALLILEGTDVPGAMGGTANFVGGTSSGGSAGNATIIAKGGQVAGGNCSFGPMTDGGTARIELFGNGTLTSYEPELTVGSVEGDGSIPLSNVSLTVGRNNLSTTFTGVISDGALGPGTLTKIGTGALTLSGANTYSGVTTVTDGSLVVNNRTGSGTGAGALNVNAGTLGGKGIISDSTTIGTGTGSGAFLAPSVASRQPAILTLNNILTFKADGNYSYKLNTRNARADQVIANGVTIESGAQFVFNAVDNKRLTVGTIFIVINNTLANPISGTFANLADNSIFTVGRNNYQVSYEGGDGNDLTLTVR